MASSTSASKHKHNRALLGTNFFAGGSAYNASKFGVNGLSHAETAQVMGLREGHVRVLQHRALSQMRDLLAKGRMQ